MFACLTVSTNTKKIDYRITITGKNQINYYPKGGRIFKCKIKLRKSESKESLY